MSCDDKCELWMNTNTSNKTNMTLLVINDKINLKYRNYISDNLKSNPVSLEAGEYYLIEAFHSQCYKNYYLNLNINQIKYFIN